MKKPMTEKGWLRAVHPSGMLIVVRRKSSARKFRLFTVACCRRVGHFVDCEPLRLILEHGERMAEDVSIMSDQMGLRNRALALGVDIGDIRACAWAVHVAPKWVISDMWYQIPPDRLTPQVSRDSSDEDQGSSAEQGARNGSSAAADRANRRANGGAARGGPHPIYRTERLAQADLLRDIMGNPFRPATLDPAWRTPDILAIAGAIYEQRAFDRMPILGDALEEAGCADPAILDHCRKPGEHARGCWLVDDLLGKS